MLRKYKFLILLNFLPYFVLPAQTQEDLTADKIYEKINNSIVVVVAYDNVGNIYQGSGVVIDFNGLVATNYHVCKDASRIEIKHYGKEFKNVEII
ncbi:MAG: hypothetical protein ACHQIH_03715, partial [Ignavibacteria bacterium]